jgi:hypothetical protein
MLEILQEILPAFYSGLIDSASPGALVILLDFSILMYLITRVQGRFILAGSLFIVCLYVTTLSIVMGYFDPLINKKFFEIFWDVGYFMLILFFISISLIFLRDRQNFLKEGSAKRLVIRFDFLDQDATQKTEVVGGERSKVLYYYLMIFCAFIVSLLTAAWPPNVYVTKLVYQGMLPGNQKSFFMLLAIYGLAFISPLIVLFVFYCLVRKSPGYLQRIRQSFSMVQMIFAAIFLGFAIHLFRYYLQYDS